MWQNGPRINQSNKWQWCQAQRQPRDDSSTDTLDGLADRLILCGRSSPTIRPSSMQPPHYCVNSTPRVPVSDPQSPAQSHCKSHLRPNAVFCLIIAITLGWNECDSAEPDKNVNEWVPLSTSVFTALPPPHISPLLAQPHPSTSPSQSTPRHATVQVVPAWGCPGRVRCPPGSCRAWTAPQMSAASFTTTNLLEARCVRAWGEADGRRRGGVAVFAVRLLCKCGRRPVPLIAAWFILLFQVALQNSAVITLWLLLVFDKAEMWLERIVLLTWVVYLLILFVVS